MFGRSDWSRSEGVTWTALPEDPTITGTFEIAWPGGRVERYAHQSQVRPILTATLPGASVLAEGLVIGPGGAVLKPDPYHTSFDYPRQGGVVVAGQGAAVRLRPGAKCEVNRSVLLLEGSAALHWPNYYHWMLPHLGRIALALDCGMLSDRALVLPQGLKSWMHETLDLVGLAPAQRVVLPPDQLTRFDDAVVLSSIEHLSPQVVAALRKRLVGSRATERPPKDGPVVYLSRRGKVRRRMKNGAEVEALAADMGLTIVVPEIMTVADQIELFSRARGIAAPEGAALTNILFAAPGTRTLSLLCVNDMMPVFNDLALIIGQPHRKIAGRPVQDQPEGTRFQPDYVVDLEVARRSFAWVAGEGEG